MQDQSDRPIVNGYRQTISNIVVQHLSIKLGETEKINDLLGDIEIRAIKTSEPI